MIGMIMPRGVLCPADGPIDTLRPLHAQWCTWSCWAAAVKTPSNVNVKSSFLLLMYL